MDLRLTPRRRLYLSHISLSGQAAVSKSVTIHHHHPHRTRSPARLLLAQAAAAAVTATKALLCCGATALSVIQGTAQPHPSSPTSAQPSLSSSPFLVHTPSKEEGKHRTEGKEGKVCCSHLLAPLLLHPHSLTAKPSTPKEPLRS